MDDAKMQGVKKVQPNSKQSTNKGLTISLDKKIKKVFTPYNKYLPVVYQYTYR